MVAIIVLVATFEIGNTSTNYKTVIRRAPTLIN